MPAADVLALHVAPLVRCLACVLPVFPTHLVLFVPLLAHFPALVVVFPALFPLLVLPFAAVRRLGACKAAAAQAKHQRCESYDGPHGRSPCK
jgi:hypothetical protein